MKNLFSKVANEFQVLTNGKNFKVTKKEDGTYKDQSHHDTYKDAIHEVKNHDKITEKEPTKEQWRRVTCERVVVRPNTVYITRIYGIGQDGELIN